LSQPQQWVLPPPPPRAPSRGGWRTLYTVLIIIGVVLLLLCAGGGFAVYKGLQAVGLSGSASLPSDFPVYPGAKQQSAIRMAPPQSGMSLTQFQWRVSGDSGPVRDFYMSRLSEGDWEITSTSSTTITFRRRSDFRQTGHLIITSSLGQTSFVAQIIANDRAAAASPS
jgi:hypothetical protein